MPDIFGKVEDDYELIQDLKAKGEWDRYQQDNHKLRSWGSPTHDFDALGAWRNGIPKQFEKEDEVSQAMGYLGSNVLAIQTQIDEVLFTVHRPMFVAVNPNIPEGAASYGVRLRGVAREATVIGAPGYEAESVFPDEGTLLTPRLRWYGLDAEWSVDEIRGAMFAGFPLDTVPLEAAVRGSLKTMEAVTRGIGNLPVEKVSCAVERGRAARSPMDIVTDELDVLATAVKSGGLKCDCVVMLPGAIYDDSKKLWRALMGDNPYTDDIGEKVHVERVPQLDNRIVVAPLSLAVAELGCPIMPRVLRVTDKGRMVAAQVESKYSDVVYKEPQLIRYTDIVPAAA